MSEYDLIPEEVWESLPQDEHDKFVVLVRTAQSNLARLVDSSSSGDFTGELQSQFVSTIFGIAEALGVEGLPDVRSGSITYDKYQMFQVYLAGIVSKVRLQSQLVSKPHSVALGRVTKARIQQEIDQLRFTIDASDLLKQKKDALKDKLANLEQELSKQRLSFARTMAIAASIMTVIGGGTTALANEPKAETAIVRIIKLIGEDKDKEEAERQRLMPPPKAIPDMRPKPKPFEVDLDDDVPF